ncbi:uncharacterized protein LOC121285838 isoform X2 [Carcharodon carcharias]|uniref:uncharacterized protein LOC121285838 isoform X2 n=1 Tax=Carcharodon carcharias TaxID=13397 RepID=UPI001B7EEE24|nr:uncharacterized protein LOC121285838 isoform X2 [Carcharodon carcharias]
MLGPKVYFRDLWNSCIKSKGLGTGILSKEEASNRAAQCASLVIQKCGGHPGSAELWSLLRESSEAKIALLDAQMSKDFKEQDFQKLHQAQFQKCVSHMRNSLGLMNRASESNQDRASAIIGNNPIPNLNDLDGKDTPMRFLSNMPSKLSCPGRKQRTLPPLKHRRQQSAGSSTSLKQEEQGPSCEKALTIKVSKEESTSNLLKKKNFKKAVKPTYPLSPKALPIKPILKAWTPELPERETNLQAMLWEPLQGLDFRKCEYTVAGKGILHMVRLLSEVLAGINPILTSHPEEGKKRWLTYFPITRCQCDSATSHSVYLKHCFASGYLWT